MDVPCVRFNLVDVAIFLSVFLESVLGRGVVIAVIFAFLCVLGFYMFICFGPRAACARGWLLAWVLLRVECSFVLAYFALA